MIRDPSDGTVREGFGTMTGTEISPATTGDPRAENAAPNLLNSRATGAQQPASGLPLESQKPKEIAKLEKARAWLKDYHGKN